MNRSLFLIFIDLAREKPSAQFFDELTAVLETLVINACPVVIGGDFNVRFQLVANPDSRRLSDVLSSFDMVQHVSGSTHRCGNTLDLVMTFVGAAPAYLADDCRLLSDVGRRPLRYNFNDTRKLLMPRTHNKLGDRSFSAAGPRLWNDLPPGLRRLGLTFDSFRQPIYESSFIWRPKRLVTLSNL